MRLITKKIIRGVSIFIAVRMLFGAFNFIVFAKEHITNGQINDESLVAHYLEEVVENNVTLLSTESIEKENIIIASADVIEDGVLAIMSYSNTEIAIAK